MIFQHVYEQPEAPANFVDDLPQPVLQIIDRLMQKVPSARYQTATELVKDIQAVRAGSNPTHYSPKQSDLAIEFSVESMADWETELADATGNTVIPRVDQGMTTQAIGLLNEHAPEAIKKLQNTYFQVKGGLAVYTTRRNELAELVETSRATEKEIADQIEEINTFANEAADAAEKNSGDDRESWLGKEREHRSAAEQLNAALVEQELQTKEARQRLDRVDRTLAELTSRHAMLMARLNAVQAQKPDRAKVIEPSKRSLWIWVGLAASIVALLYGGWLWVQGLEGNVEIAEDPSHSTIDRETTPTTIAPIDREPTKPKIKLVDTVGADTPGALVSPDDGLVDFNPVVKLEFDAVGEGWSRDGYAISLDNPTPEKRLAIPVFAKDYDLDFHYQSNGGGIKIVLPIASEGRAILETGFNEGNGVRLTCGADPESGEQKYGFDDPDFLLDPNANHVVWVWVHERGDGINITVTVNKIKIYGKRGIPANLVAGSELDRHERGQVLLVSGVGDSDLTLGRLGVRTRGKDTRLVRKLTQPTQSKLSEPNQGLYFDGDRGRIVNVRRFDYNGSHPLTIEAWVIPESKTFSHVFAMCARGNVGMIKLRVNKEQKWEFSVYNHHSKKQVRIVADEAVEWGKRIHLAGVYKPGKIQFFVNGISVGKEEGFDGPRPSGGFMRLGSDIYGGGENHFFKGVIDEFRVDNTELYNENFIPEPNLVPKETSMFCFNFNEGLGKFAVDTSGNGIHANIKSGVWTQQKSDEE